MRSFNLDKFVELAKHASRQAEAVKLVRAIMLDNFAHHEIIHQNMPQYNSNDVLLYEDEQISVWFVRFVLGEVAPPHDHQTQVAIGLFAGEETNYLFRQDPIDGLICTGKRVLRPGDTFFLGPKAIHAVTATSNIACMGLHVYLSRLSKVQRYLYDWDTGKAEVFTDPAYEKNKRDVAVLNRFH